MKTVYYKKIKKSIAEKLTGEKFNSIGWVGRYSIFKCRNEIRQKENTA